MITKTLLAFLTLCPSIVDGQVHDTLPCGHYVRTISDAMTGETMEAPDTLVVVSNTETGFSITPMKLQRGTFALSFKVVGGGCIKDGAKVNLLFTDSTRMELVSNAKFNCKGNVPVYFGGVFGRKKDLETLKTKDAKAIRVWCADRFVQHELTPELALILRRQIECLSK